MRNQHWSVMLAAHCILLPRSPIYAATGHPSRFAGTRGGFWQFVMKTTHSARVLWVPHPHETNLVKCLASNAFYLLIRESNCCIKHTLAHKADKGKTERIFG